MWREERPVCIWNKKEEKKKLIHRNVNPHVGNSRKKIILMYSKQARRSILDFWEILNFFTPLALGNFAHIKWLSYNTIHSLLLSTFSIIQVFLFINSFFKLLFTPSFSIKLLRNLICLWNKKFTDNVKKNKSTSPNVKVKQS